MFKALLVNKTPDSKTDSAGYYCTLTELDEAQLPAAGDVTVRVEWSTINYKDGLAITGKSPVVRSFPLVPGIDFAGGDRASEHPRWKAGDRVVLNGFGVGESHWGGLAQMARVKGDWLVALPEALSARDAMAIGTAGYTAMLCVQALQRHWATAGPKPVEPGQGEVLVTGAGGGVGGVAFLPEELGGPEEQAGAHLPTDHVGPLVDQQGQVAVAGDPVAVGVPNDGFGGRANDEFFL